ncbi:AaceriADL109Wp [[Ashbya] aceris (nom. inval.)]|nr:AaceriADL109Wp [[Ashbya] aceris (nom. inval.)]
MDGGSNAIGLLSRLSRRMKKPQQPLTDLTQLYSDVASETITNLGLEERGEIKRAYQGWKALQTHVLYELGRIERSYPQVHLYSNEEMGLQSGVQELYAKSQAHMERVARLYEAEGDRGRQVRSSTTHSGSSGSKAGSIGGTTLLRTLRRPPPTDSSSTLGAAEPASGSGAGSQAPREMDHFLGFDEDVNLIDLSDGEGESPGGGKGGSKNPFISGSPEEEADGSDYEFNVDDYFNHYLEGDDGEPSLGAKLKRMSLESSEPPPVLANKERVEPAQPRTPAARGPYKAGQRAANSTASLGNLGRPCSAPMVDGANLSTQAARNAVQPVAAAAASSGNIPASRRARPEKRRVKTQVRRPGGGNGHAVTSRYIVYRKSATQKATPVGTPGATTPRGTKGEPIPNSWHPTPCGSPAASLTKEAHEQVYSEDLKEELEAGIIDSLRGVDKTAAKQIFSEIVVRGDEVHWDDIAGLDSAKNSLKEAVVYPFLRPDLFRGLREPVRGMLLFGPPGTGKTMLARAVATESHSTFFSISASTLTSKYLGESEKLVRALFAVARKLSPSIIFVDEIDSILGSRNNSSEHEASRRIKTEFLVQWSALSNAAAANEVDEEDERVLVLAATNLPWCIDEAARRRFVKRQYIPLPEGETRRLQIERLLSKQKHTLTEEGFAELIRLTEGYSGSDITSLAKDAAMGPLRELGDNLLMTPRENIRPIALEDFVNSLNYIKPSVSPEGLLQYENWADKFGSSGV